MGAVVLRALALAGIILIGIIIRRIGMASEETGMMTRNLMFYVTMPAALVINYARLESMDGEMLWVALIGMMGNAVMLVLGVILTRKSGKEKQSLYMLSLSGYGTGAFTLSLTQSILPAVGNVAVCFFDMGNSVFCSGLAYAITEEYTAERRQGINYRLIIRRMLRSAPLMTSVFMTILLLLNLRLPAAVLSMLEPIAAANPFVSMLMLGLFFRVELKREQVRDITGILLIRMAFAVILAVFCYFCLPFALVLRQTLVLVSFAPLTLNTPGFVTLCGGDGGLAGAVSSISILVSLVVSLVVSGLVGIG